VNVLASVATDWLTAIGTVSAVVVALALSLGPAVRRWWQRPKLRLSVDRLEPHRLAVIEDGRLEGSELRLGVENVGRGRPAEHARSHLQTVWVRDKNNSQWFEFNVDLTPLPWSSRRSGTDPTATDMYESVIAAGLTDYVEYVYWDHKRRELVSRDARPGQQNRPHLGNEYSFRIVVTADGITPEVAVVRVVAIKSVQTVEFAAAPDPKDVRKLGLYRLYFTLGGDDPDTAFDSEDEMTEQDDEEQEEETEADADPAEGGS
jgi:hypothetical protein